MAVRRGSELSYLSANHIASIEAASRNGAITGTRKHNAFGSSRGTTGTMPTDHAFTGQKSDATGLVYMNARYYDPAIGQFVSPDTIVPDPTVVMDYNRYAYARGNPLKYNDPSGYDPLDAAWEQEFRDNHGGQDPTDWDRRDRLVSLMITGHGEGGSWTEGDWAFYHQNRFDLWMGIDPWPLEAAPGLDRFATHVERLLPYYAPDETGEFVSALALVFASMSYSNPVFAALSVANLDARRQEYPFFYDGEAGWRDEYQEWNQPHHYAAFLYMGYWFGSWPAMGVNWVRDGSLSEYNGPDMLVGNLSARHGWNMRLGNYTMSELPGLIRSSLGE